MWIPKTSKCEMCGVDYTQTSPRQKFCAGCREKSQKEYVKSYNTKYRKDHYVKKQRELSQKALREKEKKQAPGNLDKAVQYYGPYGLELVQSFFNILHNASIIAKRNNKTVDLKAIDTIMNDFRHNKIG